MYVLLVLDVIYLVSIWGTFFDDKSFLKWTFVIGMNTNLLTKTFVSLIELLFDEK